MNNINYKLRDFFATALTSTYNNIRIDKET